MVPSWIPQNIQKRIFRYILNRLAVFSDVNLDDLEVNVGTTTNLGLRNVHLDVDNISIPGVYLRSGTICELNVALAVVGGVKLTCKGVNLTVALSPTLNEDDISGILKSTTANLAESILETNGSDDDDEDDEPLMGGYGDFGQIATKLADAALSQLTLDLEQIHIKTFVNENVGIYVDVDKVTFETSQDGVRALTVRGLQLQCPEDYGETAQAQQGATGHDYSYGEMEESNMMQSMMLTRDDPEASIYMSAIDMDRVEPKETRRVPFLSCNEATATFRGLSTANVDVNVDKVKVSTHMLINFPQSLLAPAKPASESNGVETSADDAVPAEPESFEIDIQLEQLDCFHCPMTESGELESPDALTIRCQRVSVALARKEANFQVQDIALHKGDETVLVLDKEETKGFVVSLQDEGTRKTLNVLLNAPLKVSLTLDTISELRSIHEDLMPVVTALGAASESGPANKMAPKIVSTIETQGLSLVLQTARSMLHVELPPIRIASGTLAVVDSVTVELNGEVASMNRIQLELDNPSPVEIYSNQRSDASALSKLQVVIDRLVANVSQRNVDTFVQDLQAWSPGMHNRGTPAIKTRRVTIADPTELVALHFNIKKAELVYDAAQLGPVVVDLGSTIVNVFENRKLQASIWSLHVSKDFRPIDGSGHYAFLHVATPHIKPMVFVEVTGGKPTDCRLFNIMAEYHPRIFKLFQSSGAGANAAGQEEPSDCDDARSLTAVESHSKKLPIFLIDCVVALAPLYLPSRALLSVNAAADLLLGDGEGMSFDLRIRKAALLLVDNVQDLDKTGPDLVRQRQSSSEQVSEFQRQGFVKVASISAIHLVARGSEIVTVDVSAEQITLETCADSTQMLIQLLNEIKPPVEPLTGVKFQTSVPPLDVMRDVAEAEFTSDSVQNSLEAADMVSDDLPSNLEFVDSYYGDRSATRSSGSLEYSKADLLLDQDLSLLAHRSPGSSGKQSGALSDSHRVSIFEHKAQSLGQDELNFVESHFGELGDVTGAIDSRRTSAKSLEEGENAPLVIRVRDTRLVWNLHDGYDWAYTKHMVGDAVGRVEAEAREVNERLAKQGPAALGLDEKSDVHAVVGDFLFNSIYIGLPAGEDPEDLAGAINHDVDDAQSTASSMPSSAASTARRTRDGTPQTWPRSSKKSRHHKSLKVGRSRQHKVQIVLQGISADVDVFGGLRDDASSTREGVVLNTMRLSVHELEIFDNVPTSTWNRFLGYMRSIEREAHTDMVQVTMQTVQPLERLAVSEVGLEVRVLPLRLYVDQDTLDFVTRFFEFKDDRFMAAEAAEEDLFFQKVEVHSVKVKLDYKPKKVDYAGLKSGHTIEFMNFVNFDEADLVLRHVVFYGVNGPTRLADLLNGVWMPDVKSTQLYDFLSGVAPVRSLVRLGSGFRELLQVPVGGYQHGDGRLLRGLMQGGLVFAQTTANEVLKFGAKVAAGTQAWLETAEGALGGPGTGGRRPQRTRRSRISAYSDSFADDDDNEDDDEGESEQITPGRPGAPGAPGAPPVSLYANQPTDAVQGLHNAYRSLGRNIAMARNAVVDIGAESANAGSATGAVKAVMRAAPVVVIRPMIGATEAVSKALMGATNQLRPEQLQELEDKYKSALRFERAP